MFDLKEMLRILDLRLMGYYKIKERILQQNMNKYYRFESADTLCEQFKKFRNTLKKDSKEETQEKYPWLDPTMKEKTCQIGRYWINIYT